MSEGDPAKRHIWLLDDGQVVEATAMSDASCGLLSKMEPMLHSAASIQILQILWCV
jgi:hypothetical protein